MYPCLKTVLIATTSTWKDDHIYKHPYQSLTDVMIANAKFDRIEDLLMQVSINNN
jgi:hypothetical protein